MIVHPCLKRYSPDHGRHPTASRRGHVLTLMRESVIARMGDSPHNTCLHASCRGWPGARFPSSLPLTVRLHSQAQVRQRARNRPLRSSRSTCRRPPNHRCADPACASLSQRTRIGTRPPLYPRTSLREFHLDRPGARRLHQPFPLCAPVPCQRRQQSYGVRAESAHGSGQADAGAWRSEDRGDCCRARLLRPEPFHPHLPPHDRSIAARVFAPAPAIRRRGNRFLFRTHSHPARPSVHWHTHGEPA